MRLSTKSGESTFPGEKFQDRAGFETRDPLITIIMHVLFITPRACARGKVIGRVVVVVVVVVVVSTKIAISRDVDV